MTLRLDLPADQQSRLRATARLSALRAANEATFSQHPWPFLRDAVYTMNPFRDGQAGGGVQKYPGDRIKDRTPTCRCCDGGCLNYLHHVVNIWHDHPRSLWPKSRRLIMSWTFVALHVWLARYRPNQIIAFVSRKQGQNEDEGSAELIKRARWIEDHYPAEVQPRETKRTWCRTHYPHNNSVIVGIAQGADQLRQLTITAWMGDEFAFWEHAGSTYAASIPTLEGGGRCTLVSTANPGFMSQLVHDQWHVASA